jgi:hypothetical protein
MNGKLLRALALAVLLSEPGRAGDLEDFYRDLVVSVDDALYSGTLEADLDAGMDYTDTAFFTGTFDPGSALGNLSNAAFSQFQQFPIGSTVAGFTYDFDPNLAIFVRSTQGLGPVLAERAQTNGRGKLNISVAYSRIEFDVFEGHDLDDIDVKLNGSETAVVDAGNILDTGVDVAGMENPNPAIQVLASGDITLQPGQPLQFVFDDDTVFLGEVGENLIFFSFNNESGVPNSAFGTYTLTPDLPTVLLDAEINVDLYAVFANYGVTDWLDVGIVFPILTVDLQGDVTASGTFDPDQFPAALVPVTTRASDSDRKTGIGDVILRGKAKLFETEYADMAARLDVSLPTGDEDNLFGRGHAAVFGQAIFSEQFGRFSPHVNLGLFIDTEDSDQSQIRYAAGVDVRVHERVTIAGDFIGSRDLDSDGVGDTQIGAAAGLKVNVWRRLILSGNALIRLNNQGLRSDVIPSGAIEYTFF